MPHSVIGSVRLGAFATLYGTLEMSVRMHPSLMPTAFFMRLGIGYND